MTAPTSIGQTTGVSQRAGSKVVVLLEMAPSMVVRAAHRCAEEGLPGLYDERRRNGKRKAEGGFRGRVAELLQRTPQHFGMKRPTRTRELLCLQMKCEGRSAIDVSTMGRAPACIGARLGMPKPIVTPRTGGLMLFEDRAR